MELLFLVLGILIGFIVSWFILSKKTEVLNKKYSSINEEKIKLESELENLQKNQKILDKNIKESIESYVLNAMKLNNENFLELARSTLEKYWTQADKGIESKTNEIEKIIKPLEKSLINYDKKIENFQNNASKDLGSVKSYLQELAQMQNELGKQTNNLVNSLKSPKVRGRWGEIGLRRIVEYSGLNQYCDFKEQPKSEKDRLRPDMIINLPKKRKIIVDSKIPLNSYLSAAETNNEPDEKKLLKEHLKAVKESLKRLSSKNYLEKFKESIDFVVMYIEIEPALTAALIQDKNLINEALKHNIIIATPTTFVALLQTVAYGWQQFKLSENSQKILEEAHNLYNRIATFSEHFNGIGKNITSLNENFNKAVGSWEHRVSPSLKKLNDFGVKDSKKAIKNLKNIE